MSNQYAGGFISKTPPTVTTSSAQGMWTLSQQAQYQKAGTWPKYYIPIGSSYGGGFFAGQITISGSLYNLIVSPKSTGQLLNQDWGPYGSDISTGATSIIDGYANTVNLAARGSSYAPAYFCKNLSIGGFTDWYMPSLNELEVLYYYLKPNSTSNDNSSGSNANAVYPEPISTVYTASNPAITSNAGFRTGGGNEFDIATREYYWASTEIGTSAVYVQSFNTGIQGNSSKGGTFAKGNVRAIRKVLA